MPDVLDISSALFNSGLTKDADAVIINGTARYTGKVIFRNAYQRTGVMDINYQGSNPIAIVPYDLVSDWSTITLGTTTIIIEDENDGTAFKIREVKPNKPNYTVLELSYD